MHIALNRAQYFITCNGRMMHNTPIEDGFIRRQLIDLERVQVMEIEGKDVRYQQMNLFSDYNLA